MVRIVGFQALRESCADRRGTATVEYALLAALIAVVAITTFATLGSSVSNQFLSMSASV